MSSPKHRADHLAKSPARHGWRTWALTVGALLGIVALAAGVTASPIFRAKDLTVAGQSALTQDEVLQAAGVTDRTNLVYFSGARTEDRLEQHPWIDEATVLRTLPNELSIEVAERTPAATATRSGTTWLIATDGTTLGEATREKGLPSIRGVRPGEPGESPAPMRGPAAVAAAFGESVLAQKPQIDVGNDGQIEITLKKDVPVTYGDAAQPDEKALAIAGILAWADENRADIISMDVRVPYAPTAVLKRGGEKLDSGVIPISADQCDELAKDGDTTSASPAPKPTKRDKVQAERCAQKAQRELDRADDSDEPSTQDGVPIP